MTRSILHSTQQNPLGAQLGRFNTLWSKRVGGTDPRIIMDSRRVDWSYCKPVKTAKLPGSVRWITSDRVFVPYCLAATLWKSSMLNECR